MSHYVALRFETAGRYKPTVPIKVSTASSSARSKTMNAINVPETMTVKGCGASIGCKSYIAQFWSPSHSVPALGRAATCAIVVYICLAGKNHVDGVACDARDIGDA